MADVITWMTDLFGVVFATIGTTDITLGLMLALTLVTSLVMTIYRRIRGRG